MSNIPCLFCGRTLVDFSVGIDICYVYKWWSSENTVSIRCRKRNINISIKPDTIKKRSSCYLPTITLLNKGFKI